MYTCISSLAMVRLAVSLRFAYEYLCRCAQVFLQCICLILFSMLSSRRPDRLFWQHGLLCQYRQNGEVCVGKWYTNEVNA